MKRLVWQHISLGQHSSCRAKAGQGECGGWGWQLQCLHLCHRLTALLHHCHPGVGFGFNFKPQNPADHHCKWQMQLAHASQSIPEDQQDLHSQGCLQGLSGLQTAALKARSSQSLPWSAGNAQGSFTAKSCSQCLPVLQHFCMQGSVMQHMWSNFNHRNESAYAAEHIEDETMLHACLGCCLSLFSTHVCYKRLEGSQNTCVYVKTCQQRLSALFLRHKFAAALFGIHQGTSYVHHGHLT